MTVLYHKPFNCTLNNKIHVKRALPEVAIYIDPELLTSKVISQKALVSEKKQIKEKVI